MRSAAHSIPSAVAAMLFVLPAVRAADSTIEVIDFDTAVQTAQGGQYRAIGALPDQLQDRLVTIGEPAGGAWRLDVLPGAPAQGIGGVVPLFDTTARAENVPLLDVSAAPVLQVALLGQLGGRRLHVELVSGRVVGPEAPAVRLGTIEPDQLDAGRWATLHWETPADSLDRTQVGAVRFMFEGQGAGWVALAGLRFFKDAAEATALRPPVERPPIRQAMWVWRTTKILPDEAQVDKLLAFCKEQNITDLFWQIPYNKFAGGKFELLLVDEQRAFNVRAAKAGIRVHALDGAPEFVLKENHDRVFQVVAGVDRFNREGPTEGRYSAVHMDNEPYVLKNWKQDATERQRVIQDYYALNRALRQQANAAGMDYGVDIPFWWDKVDATGKREYNVQTDAGEVPLLEALFPLIQNAGIMSYRVRVLGPNGVVDTCRTEFDLGARTGVEVFASVELGTGERVEPGISFGVYPADYFLGQRDTLLRVLPFQKGCAGLAIHAYYSFDEMLEKRP